MLSICEGTKTSDVFESHEASPLEEDIFFALSPAF